MSNFKVKVTRSNSFVPMERSCNKECTYEIPTSSGYEAMAKIKVKLQGHKVKNIGTHGKVLLQNTHVKYEISTYSGS